jgi:ABC-type thiamine transport system substrate-binding protein
METHMKFRTKIIAAAFAVGAFAAPAQALTTEEVLNYKGADREKVLLDGAKKEGEVVFYSGVIVNQALRPIAEAFMKKYPFIKMTYWRAETEQIVAKVQAEVRANNVVGDVLEGTGLGEVSVQAGIVQPYYSPVVEEYPERYRDPRHLWTLTRLSYFGTAYNTKLVPPGTQPKSYEDLLDPKWKGKLSWRINTSTGTPLFFTNLRKAWGEDKAMAYFRKLKDQKIVNFGSGSARTLVDRVIAGEYPIALQIFAIRSSWTRSPASRLRCRSPRA